MQQPTLIFVKSDNKTAVYTVQSSSGLGVFEADIKEFNGNRYYEHKGIKHQLPKEFNGNKPVLRSF